MKTAMICAGLLALAWVLPVRAAEVRGKSYQAGADVDAQGKVTATQFDADVPASIANVLTAAIKQWSFVPAKRDGQAVPAHTFIRLALKALPDAQGQYSLRISFRGNGPRLLKFVGPVYPEVAKRTGVSGSVILAATVQPDGHLSELDISNGESRNKHALTAFERSALAAARQWRFAPEAVDGQPVATRMQIPVHFELRPSLTSSQAANDDTEPGIPLARDQEVALDSPLQPQSVATIVSGS